MIIFTNEDQKIVDRLKRFGFNAECLTPREWSIIKMRIFLGMSLEQIGKHYDVTRERIRQIEFKAFEKIKREIRLN